VNSHSVKGVWNIRWILNVLKTFEVRMSSNANANWVTSVVIMFVNSAKKVLFLLHFVGVRWVNRITQKSWSYFHGIWEITSSFLPCVQRLLNSLIDIERQHASVYSIFCAFCITKNAFSALTLLVGWQKGHPSCKNWVVRYWHGCLEWGANDHLLRQ